MSGFFIQVHARGTSDPYILQRWYESESTVSSGETNGPHQCIKAAAHVRDITDDDHKCCCGAKYWPEPKP